MKKIILSLMLSTLACFCYSQSTEAIKKGNSVFVEGDYANDEVKKLKENLLTRLEEWGYWKISGDKKNADFIMEVAANSSKGITLTSWGGTTVMARIKLKSKTGDTIWESDGIKSSPNGGNGFNSANSVSKKILRLLKKKFN